jgi:DNA-binding transcriptional regulator PaaX
MANRIYDEEIRQMEPGLVRATLRILAFHIGKENTIRRSDLVEELHRSGFGSLLVLNTFDRHMRAAIAELRKDGHLVCSSSGDGGYYLARDRAEYNEFAQVEYRSKITDMAETLRAMDQAAARRFGSDAPAEQGSLF